MEYSEHLRNKLIEIINNPYDPFSPTLVKRYVFPFVDKLCLKRSLSFSALYDVLHEVELGMQFYTRDYWLIDYVPNDLCQYSATRKYHTSRSYRRIEKLATQLLLTKDDTCKKPFKQEKIYDSAMFPLMVTMYNSVSDLLSFSKLNLPFPDRNVNWDFITNDPDYAIDSFTLPELLLYAALYDTTKSRSLRKLNVSPVTKADLTRAISWYEKVSTTIFSKELYVAVMHRIMKQIYSDAKDDYVTTSIENLQQFRVNEKYRERKDSDRLINTLYKKNILDRDIPKENYIAMQNDPNLMNKFEEQNNAIYVGDIFLQRVVFLAELFLMDILPDNLEFGDDMEIDIIPYIKNGKTIDSLYEGILSRYHRIIVFERHYEWAMWLAFVIHQIIQSAQTSAVRLLECLPEVKAIKEKQTP